MNAWRKWNITKAMEGKKRDKNKRKLRDRLTSMISRDR